MKTAVQLYTLRNELRQDFFGTIKKIAALGYEGVEFAGFYDIPAKEMCDILNEFHLEVVGSHTGIELLENHLDEVIDYNKIIGNKDIVIPWASVSNSNELETLIEKMKNWIKILKPLGFNLHYHNHSHEFMKINDKYILDLLLQNIPELCPEIDTHWAERAGVNPIEYLKQYAQRTRLVHLKDLVVNEGNKDFAPLGQGIMDIKGIVEEARKRNVYSLIVENDAPKNGGLQDIEISIKYLKSIL